MTCPQCTVTLQVSDRHGIEIDYCPQCRGIWLDRGELDKILERELQMAPPPIDRSAPLPYGHTPDIGSHQGHMPPQNQRMDRNDRNRRRDDDDDDDDDDRRGRRGGFLADLFDF